MTVRWGIAGKGSVCMPSTGKLTERPYTDPEREALAKGTAALGLSEAEALACRGESTCDVYLNDIAFWRSIPSRVWSYTLGGYQVIKKWLSYREKTLLGRGLKIAEATDVQHMARRIAALLLLSPRLDANYQAVSNPGEITSRFAARGLAGAFAKPQAAGKLFRTCSLKKRPTSGRGNETLGRLILSKMGEVGSTPN